MRALWFAVLLTACGANSDPGLSADEDPSQTTGGATSGLTTAAETGGEQAASPTGGFAATGGERATGGAAAPATGGHVATGGRPTTGGASSAATGGAKLAGGSSATGGGLPTGGRLATGGASVAATGGQTLGALGSPCRESAAYCDSTAVNSDTGLLAPVECIVYQDLGDKTLCVFVSSVGKDCRPRRVLNSERYTGANPPSLLCEQ